MRKGTFLATLALLIAIAGAIVAFAAYFKRRTCTLCDDYDEDLMDEDASDLDYYATQVDEEDEDAEPEEDDEPEDAAEESAPAQEPAPKAAEPEEKTAPETDPEA